MSFEHLDKGIVAVTTGDERRWVGRRVLEYAGPAHLGRYLATMLQVLSPERIGEMLVIDPALHWHRIAPASVMHCKYRIEHEPITHSLWQMRHYQLISRDWQEAAIWDMQAPLIEARPPIGGEHPLLTQDDLIQYSLASFLYVIDLEAGGIDQYHQIRKLDSEGWIQPVRWEQVATVPFTRPTVAEIEAFATAEPVGHRGGGIVE